MKRKVKNFDDTSIKIFKILFFIFPFLLISGSFLPDLLVVVLAFYCIIFYYLNNKFFFFKKNLIFFFLIFYFYININSFFSFSSPISFSTSLPYIRMILFSIFLSYLLSKIDNLKKVIFFSFLLSYLILFIDSIIQIKTGQNILGYPIVNNRIASLFGDKLVMGSYVCRTLPILLAISYLVNLYQVKFLRLLLIFLAGCLVFFSAERVSLFYFFMTVLLYLLLLPNKKQVLLHITFLTILFYLLSFFKPSTIDRVLKHTLSQLDEKKGSWFSERHEMHFITAYRMFLQNKFLGHGIKSFRYLCDQEPYSTRDLIENNNRHYSPIDGYYYLKINFLNDKSYIYYVLENHKLEFEKIAKTLEDAQILKNDSKIREAEKNFYLFEKNYPIISINFNNQVLYSIKSSSGVKKGDYVFSNNDFVNGCNTHPHSFHLQILSELGLLGYIFLFSFFIYLIFIFLKNFINVVFKKIKTDERNYNLYKIFIVLALIQHLFPIIPSGNFFNNWLSIFFYFELAFLLNFLYYNKK
jgi:O-antigen ligase